MKQVYRINSLNSDKYYLLFSVSKVKYIKSLLHIIIQSYYKSLKNDKFKSSYNDAFEVIQQNNLTINLDSEFENIIECNDYILKQSKNDMNCVNYKFDDYIINKDINKITVGESKSKTILKKERNKKYYENNKEKFKKYWLIKKEKQKKQKTID